MFRNVVNAVLDGAMGSADEVAQVVCFDPTTLVEMDRDAASLNLRRQKWLELQEITEDRRPAFDQAVQRFHLETFFGDNPLRRFDVNQEEEDLRRTQEENLRRATERLRSHVGEAIGPEHSFLRNGDDVLWRGFWTYWYAGTKSVDEMVEVATLLREEGVRLTILPTGLPGEMDVVEVLLRRDYKSLFEDVSSVTTLGSPERRFVVTDNPVLTERLAGKDAIGTKILPIEPLKKIGRAFQIFGQGLKDLHPLSREWRSWLIDHYLEKGLRGLGFEDPVGQFQLRTLETLEKNVEGSVRGYLERIQSKHVDEARRHLEMFLAEMKEVYDGKYSKEYFQLAPTVLHRIRDHFYLHFTDPTHEAMYARLWKDYFPEPWSDLVEKFSGEDRLLATAYVQGIIDLRREVITRAQALEADDSEAPLTDFVHAGIFLYYMILRVEIAFRNMLQGGQGHYFSRLHDTRNRAAMLELNVSSALIKRQTQGVERNVWRRLAARNLDSLVGFFKAVVFEMEPYAVAYDVELICRELGTANSKLPLSAFNEAQKRFLETAIHELIKNGVKYRRDVSLPNVTVTFSNNEDAIEITVVDNGRGMTKEQLADLGKKQVRFSTDVADGTGRGILELLQEVPEGWSLTVDSVYEVGTTWTLKIPRPAS